MMAEMRLAWLLPSNAFLPVSISYSTAPNAKMSVRASASVPSSCSGAMYWNVPRIVPCTVIPAGVVGNIDPLATVPAGAPVFARPKSSSLASGGPKGPPLRTSMMLPGFRSRWTIPLRCALSSASAIWMAICSASSTRRGGPLGPPVLAIRSASVSPSRNSITRKSMSSCRPTSNTGQMCGWLSVASVRASRSNRCLRSGSPATWAGSTLMATSRPRRESRARYTSPIPPAPMADRIS